jgi:hypothetical protein
MRNRNKREYHRGESKPKAGAHQRWAQASHGRRAFDQRFNEIRCIGHGHSL